MTIGPNGRAVYYEGSGSFFVGRSVVRPPGPGEVRLEVAYCGLCGTDLHIAHGAMDARVPLAMVIGHEMSGTVAEVGYGVDAFRPGTTSWCGRWTRARRLRRIVVSVT